MEVFTFGANLTAQAAGLVNPVDGNGTHTFPVAAGAMRIVASLTWNATAPADLDAVLTSPLWCANTTAPGEPAARCHAAPALGGHAEAEGWHQNAAGDPSAPDMPSALDLDAATVDAENRCDAPPCPWTARFYAKGPAANVSYDLRVEVHDPAG